MSQILKDETNPESGKNNTNESINAEKEKALELEKYFPSSSLAKSFSHALYGIKETWFCERNFKVHTICATIALTLGFLLKIDAYSWLALVLVTSFVLTVELINTALEHLVDLAANSLYHPLAKAAKDAAAGAVLIASLSAVTCGLIIFCPRLPFLYEQILRLLPH
jgi:undecaprenol kinase